MTNKNDLQEQELNMLQEEVNLEDLLVLGNDKKIPILIEYPNTDGHIVKARVLAKQLTLKELDNFKVTKSDDLVQIMQILTKTIFKNNGEYFTNDELALLPVGVLKALFEKIFELSGLKIDEDFSI